MENLSISACYAQKVGQPSLGLIGILVEAFKISIGNWRLLLFNTFILFSYYALIRLANLVISDAPNSSAFGFVALLLGCLIILFSVTASVHSTFEAYTAKVILSLKEMLLGAVKGRLIRAVITSILMAIITSVTAAFFFLLYVIIAFSSDSGQYLSLLSALAFLVTVVGTCCIVYLCSLWMFSLVISVIEDELSGLKAISEATQLMRGKGMQGIVLTVLLMLVVGAIFGAFNYLQGKVPVTENAKVAMVIDLAISVPKVLAFCIWILVAFAVYTLFYHECKVRKTGGPYDPITSVADL